MIEKILIPIVSALIGAIAGSASSIWITRKQLQLQFDRASLDSVQARLTKLENLAEKLSALLVSADGDPSNSELASRYTQRFTEKYRLVRPFFHLLPRALCDELAAIVTKSDQLTVTAIQGGVINENDAKKTFDDIGDVERKLDHAVAAELRHLQSRVEYLTSSARNDGHQGV